MANLPLRLESSFEQWWFVAPIDWAAANGHTEVVKELLRMDPALFHNLTSKRRMHRLEKLWDDQDAFSDAAIGRSKVVKDLLQEFHIDHNHSESSGQPQIDHDKHIKRGLFEAGYGVWVLYIAAAAGDEALVNQMISANPDLIRGDSEFGLSDLLYAAARGQNIHIFQQILTLAKRRKKSYVIGKSEVNNVAMGDKEDLINGLDYVGISYNNKTIQSKALLAAARAGNVEMVRELLKDNSTDATVLSFRDSNGSTALHAAAGRGHLEVVRLILELCPASISGQDVKENTALHIAARRGCLQVAIEMLRFNKETIYMKNKNGETPLHSAVMGTKQAPPKLIMKQGGRIEVVKQLLAYNNTVPDYINWKTNQGQTALHLSVTSSKMDDKLVALLLQAAGISVSEMDNQGFTALDLARACKKRHPAAEFRCNIAISLLTAADSVEREARCAAGRSGPGSAAMSVDLADPLMCSFSHDIVIVSEGENPPDRRRRFAATESVDVSTELINAAATAADRRVPVSTDDGLKDRCLLPDDETLSRNLAFLQRASAGIFEPPDSSDSTGTPSPTQCFSALQSLLPGRRPVTSRESEIWARTLKKKKWNKYPQCMASPDGSRQSLRQQFSSCTDNVLFHPTPPESDLRQEPTSISVSPFASPTRSESPAFSPSYIKSWLKKAFINQTDSMKSPSSSKKETKEIQKKIKQITSLTHLGSCSASRMHNKELQNTDSHNEQELNYGAAMENHELNDAAAPRQLSTGRQSSHMNYQCFCLDLFNVGAARKEDQSTGFVVMMEEESPLSSSSPPSIISAQLTSNYSALQTTINPQVESSVTDSSNAATHELDAANTRSSGSSPISSPARPSASLSLSPWLSPTLRAARKREIIAPSSNADYNIDDEQPTISDSPNDTTIDSSMLSLPPLIIISSQHQHTEPCSTLNPNHHNKRRQDSFSLCCGPCFQDEYLCGLSTDSREREREQALGIHH